MTSLKYKSEKPHMALCIEGFGAICRLLINSCFFQQANFRIAATGVILDLDKSVTIVKKLKLIGYPYKIYKNTCFIKVGKLL